MTKEELVENLKDGEVVVTFKKKDGTERIMRCTKSFDSIPEEKRPKTTNEVVEKPTTTNTDLIMVWDLDKEGWRSFDYKTLLKIGE
ncbi:DUF2693 domain-containing protein [archaeon]|jgi:hypothetical protein|nr:DUF2693 domain-containing protein [archaeon]NDB54489.1 DUF2693 domain-containing protein [archaeon]